MQFSQLAINFAILLWMTFLTSCAADGLGFIDIVICM